MDSKSRRALEVLALGLAFGATLPAIEPRQRDQQPRKFTDARKAAAEAKRQRKNAKRLARKEPK